LEISAVFLVFLVFALTISLTWMDFGDHVLVVSFSVEWKSILHSIESLLLIGRPSSKLAEWSPVIAKFAFFGFSLLSSLLGLFPESESPVEISLVCDVKVLTILSDKLKEVFSVW